MPSEPSDRNSKSSAGVESISSLDDDNLDLTAFRETLPHETIDLCALPDDERGSAGAIAAPVTSAKPRGSALMTPAGEGETHRPPRQVSFANTLLPEQATKHHKSIVSLLSERDSVAPPAPPTRGSIASNASGSNTGQSFEVDVELRRSSEGARRSLGTIEGSFDVGTQSSCTSEDTTDFHHQRRRLLSTATGDGGLMDAAGEVDLARFANQSSNKYRPSVESPPLPPLWMKHSEAGASAQDDKTMRGRYFDSTVWAYYTHSGRWSDGMGAPVQDCIGTLFCCCPFLWPMRLFMTLRRAIPVTLRLACCQCQLRAETAVRNAGALTLLAATLVLVPFGLVVALLYTDIRTKSKAREVIQWRDVLSSTAPGIAILTLPFLLGVLVWAAIFQAVGWKYNIRDPQERPVSFFLKVCCCLPAMNVRVGLHVDRAQGFTRANKYVRQMIRMSECVRVAVGESIAPLEKVELSPIQHSISRDVLADDNIRQAVEGTVKVEEHARRLSQGRPSRTPFLFE